MIFQIPMGLSEHNPTISWKQAVYILGRIKSNVIVKTVHMRSVNLLYISKYKGKIQDILT